MFNFVNGHKKTPLTFQRTNKENILILYIRIYNKLCDSASGYCHKVKIYRANCVIQPEATATGKDLYSELCDSARG